MTTNLKNGFCSKRKQEKEKFQVGLQTTYIIMLSFISVLLLYYVWILNVNATKGTNIQKLNIQMQQLKLERELLDVRIAELESLDNIRSKQDLEMMEKAENPDYLVIREWVNYVYNY